MFRCQRQKKIRQVQMQDTALGPFPYTRNETTQYFRLFFPPVSLSYQTGAVARKQVQCTELTAANKMLKTSLFFVSSHFTKQTNASSFFFSRTLPGNSRIESWKLPKKISHLLMPYCKVWRKRALRCQNSPERTSVASIARYRRRISPCSSLRDTGE